MAKNDDPQKPQREPRPGLEWAKVPTKGGGYVWREVKKNTGSKLPSPLGGHPPGEGPSVRDRSRSRGESPFRTPGVDLPLKNASSKDVAMRGAQLAGQHYYDPDLQGLPDATRKRRASEKAYNELITQASSGKSNMDLSDSSPGAFHDLAFGPAPRKMTDEEQIAFTTAGGKRSKQNSEVAGRNTQDQEIFNKIATKQAARSPLKDTSPKEREEIQNKAKQRAEFVKKLQPGQAVAKGKMSPQDYMYQADPDERQWMLDQMQKPDGLFFGATGNQVPGAYRRLQRYTNARQDTGATQAGAPKAPINGDESGMLDWLQYDGRGKSGPSSTSSYKTYTDKAVENSYKKGVQNTQGVRSQDRYKSKAPSHEDFGIGVAVPGIPKLSELEAQFPDMSDQQLVALRQSYKESAEQFVVNQKQSIESQRAQMLGKDATDNTAHADDRVVFFTTSVGAPALSVSANSMVGQYIIQKRKQMLVDTKQKTRAQVKGEFPAAVRDQHVVELASGVSLGAQGRYGAFKHVGWKAGSKKSKGYGKMQPVGASIIRDSSGQPIYDNNGNVRYTEGYTRGFDIRPSNDVGLRVYIG